MWDMSAAGMFAMLYGGNSTSQAREGLAFKYSISLPFDYIPTGNISLKGDKFTRQRQCLHQTKYFFLRREAKEQKHRGESRCLAVRI